MSVPGGEVLARAAGSMKALPKQAPSKATGAELAKLGEEAKLAAKAGASKAFAASMARWPKE